MSGPSSPRKEKMFIIRNGKMNFKFFSPRVREVTPRFLESRRKRGLRPISVVNYRVWCKRADREIGDLRLAALTPEKVEGLAEAISRNFSETLITFLRWAQREKLLPKSHDIQPLPTLPRSDASPVTYLVSERKRLFPLIFWIFPGGFECLARVFSLGGSGSQARHEFSLQSRRFYHVRGVALASGLGVGPIRKWWLAVRSLNSGRLRLRSRSRPRPRRLDLAPGFRCPLLKLFGLKLFANFVQVVG